MLVADADGERHRHDTAADRCPEAVQELLQTLTPDQRAVIVLRVLDRFSVEETARIIGKSAGAVKVLQNRGIASLRKTLGRHVPARLAV